MAGSSPRRWAVAAGLAITGAAAFLIYRANDETSAKAVSEAEGDQSPGTDGAASGTGDEAGETSAGAAVLAVNSQLPELKIIRAARLPANPFAGNLGDCSLNLDSPATTGGAMVQAQGWILTAEVSAGGYDAVSFAGNLTMGTSGSCFVRDANVGLFRGNELKAIISGETDSFRGVTYLAKSPAGKIRLYGDIVGYGTPFADVDIDAKTIAIIPLPKREQFCGGRVEVPNVRSQNIAKARGPILAAGWQPKPNDSEDNSPGPFGDSMPETQYCSGTGFGLCSFAYQHPAGPVLTVTSMGEESSVADFDVTCAPTE